MTQIRMTQIRFRSWYSMLGVAALAFWCPLGLSLAHVGWTEGDHVLASIAAIIGALAGWAAWRTLRSGYVLDRGALGHFNGVTGHVAWIELHEVLAATPLGRRGSLDFKGVVLWVPGRARSWWECVTQWLHVPVKPPHVHDLERHHGAIQAMRIDFTMLGRRNSRIVLAALERAGLHIPDELLPPYLKRASQLVHGGHDAAMATPSARG